MSSNVTPEYSANPQAIRHCLAHLLDDCLATDLALVALHLRIAIMELDDVLADDAEGEPESSERSAA